MASNPCEPEKGWHTMPDAHAVVCLCGMDHSTVTVRQVDYYRLQALLAERDARIAALVAEAAPLRRVFDALNRYQEAVERAKCGEPASDMRHAWAEVKAAADSLRAALAAAGWEGQG